MEGKKASFVDEYFPPKEATIPSKSDILSSIFPPQSLDAVNDSSHYELLPERERKEGFEGLSSTKKIGASDGSFHISQAKNHDGLKKNSDPIMPCEIAEPCLMSSSVYYGGRDDFVSENSSSYRSGNTYNNMKDNEDASSSDLANRGEWWQGSFYY